MLVILATYLEVKEAEQKKTPESEELKVISILIPSYLELCCVNPNPIMNGWDLEVQLEYFPTAGHMAQAATQSCVSQFLLFNLNQDHLPDLSPAVF